MIISGSTDVGKKRDNNQDCFEICALSDFCSLMVVCDGMGGANGGNIASTLARDTIVKQIKAQYNQNMNGRSIKNMLISAVTAANITVFDKSLSVSSLSGMGTTTVAVIISKGEAYIAHVGDSRAYLINTAAHSIEQITTDHSIVQMMVETGQITSVEAKVHPKRNIITRAIGVNDNVKVDFSERPVGADEKILLCSDGLSNFVSNDVIMNTLCANSGKDAVNILIDEANANGGGDNITVVIAE